MPNKIKGFGVGTVEEGSLGKLPGALIGRDLISFLSIEDQVMTRESSTLLESRISAHTQKPTLYDELTCAAKGGCVRILESLLKNNTVSNDLKTEVLCKLFGHIKDSPESTRLLLPVMKRLIDEMEFTKKSNRERVLLAAKPILARNEKLIVSLLIKAYPAAFVALTPEGLSELAQNGHLASVIDYLINIEGLVRSSYTPRYLLESALRTCNEALIGVVLDYVKGRLKKEDLTDILDHDRDLMGSRRDSPALLKEIERRSKFEATMEKVGCFCFIAAIVGIYFV